MTRKHALINVDRHRGHRPDVAAWQRAWGRCRCGEFYRDRSIAQVRLLHRGHLEQVRGESAGQGDSIGFVGLSEEAEEEWFDR